MRSKKARTYTTNTFYKNTNFQLLIRCVNQNLFRFHFRFWLRTEFFMKFMISRKICERQVFVKHDPNLHKTEKEIALQYFMNLN